jgi:hypothetical protein
LVISMNFARRHLSEFDRVQAPPVLCGRPESRGPNPGRDREDPLHQPEDR